jgi:hypothetical protein
MATETSSILHPIITLALCFCIPPSGCGRDDDETEGGESSSTMASGAPDSTTTSLSEVTTTTAVDSSESGESGEAPLVDACLNEGDQAILAMIDIEMIANGCGTSNVGDVAGAVACVEEQSGISTDCASCFGLTIGCVFEQCLPACFDAASTECVDCRTTNCDPPFLACSGL